MALTVKQLVKRHGAFVSAMTALFVGAALIVQRLFEILIASLHVYGQQFGVGLWQILLPALPFAFGFFVSLWIVAPIAEELRIPHVVTRAVMATGVASTVVFIVLTVVGLATAVSFDGYLFGQSFPAMRFDGSWAINAIVSALTNAALTFVSTLPLGVLAGVLLWIWRKDHPPRHPLSGLIDEV
ncbi:MAG: hypothetical protein KF761_11310 [Salinibacterium sp.]|nr:hypothetical protein [Salinibacterium sp.]